MRIPSCGKVFSFTSVFTSVASALNLRGSHSANNAAILPQDIHSLLQANSHAAGDTNFLRREKVSDYITPWSNDDGSPTVSTNAELCQHSWAYQCVGSTVAYGTNSSADLTGYVLSENSGVKIFQDDIDRFAMEFAQAAIPNAENDVNSTSASLDAYSQNGEFVAGVNVNDPDMQLVQLKAVRTLLKNMAVADGHVTIIVEDTIINDDSYGQDDDYSSYSYPTTYDPFMTYFAIGAMGALFAVSIVACVLAICLCQSCGRERARAGAVARDESTLELVEKGTQSDLISSETASNPEEQPLTPTSKTTYYLRTIGATSNPEEQPLTPTSTNEYIWGIKPLTTDQT